MHTNHSHGRAYKTTIRKTESVSLTWIQLGLFWWPNLCLTAHEPRTDYMQRLSARWVLACPHKGYYQYSNRSLDFWNAVPAAFAITGRSRHSGQSQSDLTQHNWEIYVDARVIQPYNSLHGQKIKIHLLSSRLLADSFEYQIAGNKKTSPEVSSFSESFSAWLSSFHFLSQLSLHRTRGPSHHPHQRTWSCRRFRHNFKGRWVMSHTLIHLN